MKEWETYMSDFVPEDMTTIVIDPRQEVVSWKESTKCYHIATVITIFIIMETNDKWV
jgi:hypothetical protein